MGLSWASGERRQRLPRSDGVATGSQPHDVSVVAAVIVFLQRLRLDVACIGLDEHEAADFGHIEIRERPRGISAKGIAD